MKTSETVERLIGIVRSSTLNHMLDEGARLVGANPEYDRGVYELIANVNVLALPKSVQGDGDAARRYVKKCIAVIKAGA